MIDFITRTLGSKNKLLIPGIVVFLTSRLCWIVAFLIVPFMPIQTKTKVITTGISYALSEVLFYIALFMVGKQVILKLLSYLNPFNWFKKKKGIEPSHANVELKTPESSLSGEAEVPS